MDDSRQFETLRDKLSDKGFTDQDCDDIFAAIQEVWNDAKAETPAAHPKQLTATPATVANVERFYTGIENDEHLAIQLDLPPEAPKPKVGDVLIIKPTKED
jgi:hypothetical protein